LTVDPAKRPGLSPLPDWVAGVIEEMCRRHGVRLDDLRCGDSHCARSRPLLDARVDVVAVLRRRGLDYRQIARAAGLSSGSVAAYIRRAKQAGLMRDGDAVPRSSPDPDVVDRLVSRICRRNGVAVTEVRLDKRRPTQKVARVRMLIAAALRGAPHSPKGRPWPASGPTALATTARPRTWHRWRWAWPRATA
jgi:DNA-binding CsgD family transcriptional regulator